MTYMPCSAPAYAHARRYQIIEVEDNGNDTPIEKRFTLWNASFCKKFDAIAKAFLNPSVSVIWTV